MGDMSELVRLLATARNNLDAIDGTPFGDMGKMLDKIAVDVARALHIAEAARSLASVPATRDLLISIARTGDTHGK